MAVTSSLPARGLQALLALLALAVPNSVSSDRLIDELWGDEQPGNPDNALQAKISQLRRLLGRDVVVRKDTGYLLDVDPDAVDVLRLEKLVRQGRVAYAERGLRGRRGSCTRRRWPCSTASRSAISPSSASPGPRRPGSTSSCSPPTRALADCRLALGQHADAVGPLIDAVRDHPYRERFHAQLMLALYRCGRQADALRAYKSARDVLVEELGLEPGAELQALQQAVLAHDPALTASVAARAADARRRRALPGQRDLDAWRADAATQRQPGRPAAVRRPGRDA